MPKLAPSSNQTTTSNTFPKRTSGNHITQTERQGKGTLCGESFNSKHTYIYPRFHIISLNTRTSTPIHIISLTTYDIHVKVSYPYSLSNSAISIFIIHRTIHAPNLPIPLYINKTEIPLSHLHNNLSSLRFHYITMPTP